MKIEFALRDEIVNIFAMTYGEINSKVPYQIMLCKKKEFNVNRRGPFLLDTKKSSSNFKLSSIGTSYLKNIENMKYDLKFIAFVDEQIKIKINENLIDNICQNFFPLWDSKEPLKYFEGNLEGYIILFRVYEIEESISEELLDKGRKGRNYYYGLKEKINCTIKKPVLQDDEYLKIKQGLINIIQGRNISSKIDIYYENKDDVSVVKEQDTINYEMSSIDLDEEFEEGNEKLVYHKKRERNKKLINNAKKLFKIKNNRLFCEVCGFDFEKVYGDIGKDFIEAHHNIPISTMEEYHKTRVEDIIMVCSNCHRMLHRKQPFITKEDLKKKLNR